jgi:hypothetical protein
MAERMAETNAGREERPETGSEEETSRDYSTGSEGTVGEVQATEEERIAQAIDGKGEFLSTELKKLLKEIEVVQGLRAGALGEEIEARLRGVTEPSVEKLREALREEIEKLEERFNVRRGKGGASENPGNPTRTETGEDPGGTPKPAEAPDGGGPGGRGGIYVPDRASTGGEESSIARERGSSAVQVRRGVVRGAGAGRVGRERP